jgi:hypothetical protein
MKRLIVTAFLCLGLFMAGNAQTASKSDDKAAMAAQKKADKEKKKAEKEADKNAAQNAKSTGTNKDGTPDMRLKKNKDAAKAAQTTTQPVSPVVNTPVAVPKNTPKVTPQPTTPVVNNPAPSHVNQQSAIKSADKAVGTDPKGRTIYEGSKGGRYYINKNGNKEYIKKG